jgi:phage-related baseplate assembly protein
MSLINVAALLVSDTAARWKVLGLQIANALGLVTTSWRTGDPTLAQFDYHAEALENRDARSAELAKAAWLSTATGDWLTVLASEVFGVDRVQATYAAPSVTVQNSGGAFYPIAPGDLTFKDSVTQKTYRNTNGDAEVGGPLSAGVFRTYELIADEPGSGSTTGANDIDQLVTTRNGVVIISSTSAIGVDQQADDSLKLQCLASLGALSPNGPADAYEFVARKAELTGVQDVTRARAIGDSTTGFVTLYIAGASGPVAGASVTAVQAAILKWATPLCITPTTQHAGAVTINVTATISGPGLPFDAETLATNELLRVLSAFQIASSGGDSVDTTLLTKAIRDGIAVPIKTLSMTIPAAPVALTLGQYPVLGTVSITEV